MSKPDPQTTDFRPGERVGCHRNNYERPGYIIGPGDYAEYYDVHIVGLGRMNDVSADQLRRPSEMSDDDRKWIDKVERVARGLCDDTAYLKPLTLPVQSYSASFINGEAKWPVIR